MRDHPNPNERVSINKLPSSVLLVAFLAPTSVLGQSSSTVDIGAGSIDYDGTRQFSVYSVAPRVFLSSEYATLAFGANFSRFDEGWGSRGLAALSFLTPDVYGFRAEVSGRGELNANRVITAARQAVAGVRLHFSGDHSGGWVGTGVARVWNGAFWQTSDRNEAGLWADVGRAVTTRLSLDRAQYRVRESSNEMRSFYSLEFAVMARRGRFELDGSAGRQFGDAFDGTTIWALNGAFWITRFAALSATAGRYATDRAQRLPGGSYFSMGMRLAPVRVFVPPREVRPPSPNRRFTATGGGDTPVRTLRYFGTATKRVEVSGSFTDWRPVQMRKVAGGLWEVTLVIGSGSHYFNIRVDGAAWFVPEGTTAVDDDFNGRVGLLVVPR